MASDVVLHDAIVLCLLCFLKYFAVFFFMIDGFSYIMYVILCVES